MAQRNTFDVSHLVNGLISGLDWLARILIVLQLVKYLRPRVTYLSAFFQMTFFDRLVSHSFGSLFLTTMKESELPSWILPLLPFERLYLLTLLRLTPSTTHSLTHLAQNNLSSRAYPLSVATRTAGALAQLANEYPRTARTDRFPWTLQTLIFLGMYRLASKSIVQPSVKWDLALAKVMKDLGWEQPRRVSHDG
jgi:hypothetical protein